MNEIEIFENFDQFDKIIKKQKEYIKLLLIEKKWFFIYFLLCVSLFVFIGAQFHYMLAILGLLFGTLFFLYNRKIIF